MLKNYSFRFLKLIFGLFVFATGLVMCIQANIGLAPWEVFHQGLVLKTGITYGTAITITGILLVILGALVFREKIGIGTILNAVLVGVFTDVIMGVDIIIELNNFWLGVVMLLVGQFLLSVGTYFYISTGFGAGPRDTIMIALKKRLPKVPVGLIRGAVEGVVLIIGYFLGGKVGVGTVIAVFGISFILQFTFMLFRFNVEQVKHESIIDTAKLIMKKA